VSTRRFSLQEEEGADARHFKFLLTDIKIIYGILTPRRPPTPPKEKCVPAETCPGSVASSGFVRALADIAKCARLQILYSCQPCRSSDVTLPPHPPPRFRSASARHQHRAAASAPRNACPTISEKSFSGVERHACPKVRKSDARKANQLFDRLAPGRLGRGVVGSWRRKVNHEPSRSNHHRPSPVIFFFCLGRRTFDLVAANAPRARLFPKARRTAGIDREARLHVAMGDAP